MKTILLIEDDLYLNKVYSDGLTHAGFKVVSAFNGEVGLEKAKQEKPDLILLDLMLPIISGEKVLADLKTDEKTKDIPVIVLSNKSEEASINHCVNVLGATGYIVKIDAYMEDIIEVIKSNLK